MKMDIRFPRWIAIATIACSGCAAPVDTGEEEPIAEADDALYGDPTSFWPVDDFGVTTVPVCWVTPGWASEKAMVKSRVEEQWGAYSTIKFTGWGECPNDCSLPAPRSQMIRISIDDVQPESSVGAPATTTESDCPSMTLNFSHVSWGMFTWFWDGDWYTTCFLDSDYCTRQEALHEFGHALGFHHEQDRPDNFGRCDNEPQHQDSGKILTEWDNSSIMNYCAGHSQSELSTKDILGLQEVYGLAHHPAAIIMNVQGQLQAFARHAPDNAIWTATQTSPNTWSAWQSLGGGTLGTPAVGKNLDGRLEVVVRGTDNQVYHNWQLGDGSWYGWYPYPALTVSSAPAIASNNDGRLEVVVRDEYGFLQHIWQTAPNSGWSDWASYGVFTSSAPVMIGQQGKLNVFARDFNGAIGYLRQTYANGSWDSWRNLGGQWTSPPSVSFDGLGRISVAALGRNRSAWITRQNAVGDTGFNGWTTIGGGAFTSAPTLALNWAGELMIFGRGTEGGVWFHRQMGAGGSSWSPWNPLFGVVTSGMSVGYDLWGQLHVLARGTDKAFYRAQQVGHNGGWNMWFGLGETWANSNMN